MRIKRTQVIFIVITILWIGVIWGHSLQPAVTSDKESLGILALIQPYIPFEITNHLVRKTAHFTEYFILGALYMQCLLPKIIKKWSNVGYAIILSFFTSFIDETIQLFVEGRSGQISDVWLDFSGSILAIIFTCVIIKLRKK